MQTQQNWWLQYQMSAENPDFEEITWGKEPKGFVEARDAGLLTKAQGWTVKSGPFKNSVAQSLAVWIEMTIDSGYYKKNRTRRVVQMKWDGSGKVMMGDRRKVLNSPIIELKGAQTNESFCHCTLSVTSLLLTYLLSFLPHRLRRP